MPGKKRNEKGAASRTPRAAGSTPGLRITLRRSLIGMHPKHVRTLQALGLRRIRATVRHEDTPVIRGMIAQVPYAVSVEPEKEHEA